MTRIAPAAGVEGALPPSFGLPRDIYKTKAMKRGVV